MDACRFDVLTRAIGRRGLLGTALGLAGPALLATDNAAAGQVACDKKQTGARCKNDRSCCSGRCKRKKKRKKGRCRCSRLLEPCFDNFDCCARLNGSNDKVVCSNKDGFDEILCCVASGGQCRANADCCAEFSCNGGVCGNV